ncbi:MAG: ABC transporter substrate-binding protein [Elioraea sp.]|nr:ABC transporter substrate-binding protein [Elioraea sp.]MDW8444956.1 ABC transporter substrate-binding protein [Acetobacteraceae bacterium]
MWSSFSALLVLLLAGVGAEAKPSRVVSLNLCADQFVLALADRDRIAALSPLAADPALSAAAERAHGLARVRPVLEEVLPLRPDLAIAGAWGGARVAAVLEARGVRVLRLGLANDFPDIVAQTRAVAEALGEAARGEAVVQAMASRLEAAPRPARSTRVLVWEARGFTAGAGTLADAVLRAAGLANAAPFAGYGTVPLERLVAAPPDLLVTLSASAFPSLSEALLDHPALAPLPRLSLPAAWLACGGPDTVRAVRALTDRR